MEASIKGHTEVVRLLLSAGAKQDWTGRDGTTALMEAEIITNTTVRVPYYGLSIMDT